ncbi:MAG: type II toxin-antitoxin system ParD family antitoxin [Pseudomonadales bacterium]
MNIDLTPQLEEWVRLKVASGLYSSASEVVLEALRLMGEQDRLQEAKLDQLRNEVREGLASGPSKPWDAEAFKRQARSRQTRSRQTRSRRTNELAGE